MMNESDFNDRPGELVRRHPANETGDEERSSGTIFSALVGFTLGFLIAAGVVVFLRVMKSESDGTRALMQALIIFGPALCLVVIGAIIRKSMKRVAGFSKPARFMGAIIGLAYGGSIWVTVPTNEEMAREMLTQNRDLFITRASQLAACREQLDTIATGSLDTQISEAQLTELKSLAMDFRHEPYTLPITWNALLTADTDYVRLKPDTDPDTIIDRWTRPKSKFIQSSDYRYSYNLTDFVDDLADIAYGDPSLWPDRIERLVVELKQLKYVVIVRMTDGNAPLLTGNQFQFGYLKGEAFCFDLEAKRLVAGFTFAATNSDTVGYNYAQNANVTAQADSAGGALASDLEKNAWLAFWHRLHQVAGSATSPFSAEKLPYSEVSLAEAMLIMQEKQRTDKEREKAVMEKLQGANAPITEPATGDIVLSAEQEAEIRTLLAEGSLIMAVKRVRDLTGRGLADCKAYVDAMAVPK